MVQKLHSITFFILLTAAGITSCSKTTPTPVAKVPVVTVSTLAGSGAIGSANGVGVAASFNTLSGVTLGGGYLYVADWLNNMIRKVNISDGTTTTFTGTLASGYLNGTITSAVFNGPANCVFDKSGNLYIADEQNSRIREVTTAGTVITVAGSGAVGSANGMAAVASFNKPDGMVFDANGDLYIVDDGNNLIRKLTMATGVVSTYAGTGVAGFTNGVVTNATFNSPYGLAIDATGNLYVGDIVNNCIRKISVATGMVSTFAGTGTAGLTNGTALSATFYYPAGVAFDGSGNLFVSELKNNTIRKISTDGTVSTYAGSGTQGATDGPASGATFYHPLGLTVDGNGTIYVADEYNNKVRKITSQ